MKRTQHYVLLHVLLTLPSPLYTIRSCSPHKPPVGEGYFARFYGQVAFLGNAPAASARGAQDPCSPRRALPRLPESPSTKHIFPGTGPPLKLANATPAARHGTARHSKAHLPRAPRPPRGPPGPPHLRGGRGGPGARPAAAAGAARGRPARPPQEPPPPRRRRRRHAAPLPQSAGGAAAASSAPSRGEGGRGEAANRSGGRRPVPCCTPGVVVRSPQAGWPGEARRFPARSLGTAVYSRGSGTGHFRESRNILS